MNYNSKTIADILFNNYEKSAKYLISNIYAFSHAYGETDFLVVNQSGFCYDIEIKISRADFKADFKKGKKHSILKDGVYRNSWKTAVLDPSGKKKWTMVPKHKEIKATQYPNRFYYAVPTGLIKVEELPEYAGLLYIDEIKGVTKIKEAPLLHKTKLNVEKLLCRKFYFRWMNAKSALEICKG